MWHEQGRAREDRFEGVFEKEERFVKLSKYGLLTSDVLIVAAALRLGVPIYTFDQDLRTPGLEVRPWVLRF